MNYHNIKRNFIFILLFSILSSPIIGQCVYTVNPTEITIPGEGGSAYVYIETSPGCEEYGPSTYDEWFGFWIDYYEQILYITAELNNVGYRTGTITIDDYLNDDDHPISISQGVYQCQQLPSPGLINGPGSVCAESSANYYISPVEGATLYHWYYNGELLNQYGTSVTINFILDVANTSATITACAYNDCGNGVLSSKVVTAIFSPYFGGTISPSQTICYNSDASFISYSVPPGGYSPFYYQWQLSTDGGSVWSNITGANSTSYDPPNITIPTKYRVIATDINGCGFVYSNVVNINLYSQTSVTGGMISGDYTSCYGYVAGMISNQNAASNGSGSYTYSWEKSTDNGNTWTYAGGNAQSIDAGQLTITTWYRRKVTDNVCGSFAYTNNIVIKTVRELINPGIIGSDETLCYNGNPSLMEGTDASGGSGDFIYNWENSEDGSYWQHIQDSCSIYDPSLLTSTTFYKRIVVDSQCGSSESNVVTKTIRQPVAGGSISNSNPQTICYNADAPILTNSSAASGGSNSFSYQWQSSINGGSNWNDVPGATSTSYDPPSLTITTIFKRRATDNAGCGVVYSNPLTVQVYLALSAGSISGDYTSCYGYETGMISNQNASNGSGSYTYSWEKSVDNGNTWSNAGGNSLQIDAGILITTTWYRRKVSDNVCGTSAYSNNVIKTVRNQFNPGVISSDETVCYNGDPNIMSGSTATGGAGNFTYAWEKSEDNGANWTLIAGDVVSFDPSNLTTTTNYWRRATDSQCGSNYSNIITKTVATPVSGGAISNSNPQTICYNADAPILTNSSAASGGSNSFAYQWQSSINGGSNWNDVSGATSTSYDPPSLTITTLFKRRATDNAGCGVVYSNPITVQVYQQLSAGSISGDYTSCYGYVAGMIANQNAASNGSGSYTYSWEKSTDNGNTWTYAGGNAQSIDAGQLTITTWYRRKVTDNVCGSFAYTNNTVIKTVRELINPGIIGSDETLCYNGNPSLMEGTDASGGSGDFIYNWEISEDGSYWQHIQDSCSIYDPSLLTSTTFYKRIAADSQCGSSESNVVTKTIRQPVAGGSISNSNPQTLCYNTDAPILTNSSAASGGSNSFSYQWQSSINGGSTWDDVSGATSASYDPPSLTITTIFKRRATDNAGCGVIYSNPLTVQVYLALSAGSISGDNTSCYGYVAGLISNQQPAINGSGSYSYSWEKSVDDGSIWSNAGGNTLQIDAWMLANTTWFRRKVTDAVCGTVLSTNIVIKTVRDSINAGIITGNEELCYNEDASIMSGDFASGGTNTFVYNWETSVDGYSWTLAQDSSFSFDPSPLTTTTYFKRVAIDDLCGTAESNVITKTVYLLDAGAIAGNQTIDYNTNPASITSTQPASGTFGTYSYQWQISTNQSAWDNITDANGLGYNPGQLISTKFYRRSVSDQCGTAYSNTVSKTWVFPEVSYIDHPDMNRELNTSLQVGSTSGQISTTPMGGSSYTIPVFCSPGTNGVKPSLAVQYNSQSGNGLLGWGWNLTGLSSISRIPKPYYVNQEVKGIAMTSDDELALDGNRLVFDQSSSVYLTELETFSETTAHGTSGSGPEWFEVKMKDSSTYEYGREPNSFLKNNQNTKFSWYLTKYKDVYGNYIKYNYTLDQSSGQVFLSSIQYTGNEPTNSDPYNEIIIQYGKRSDPYKYFFPGVIVKNDLLISRIICKTEGQISRTYDFDYNNISLNSLYSTLVSVNETASDGTKYNSTIFKYNDQLQSPTITGALNVNGKNNFCFADFNGDGKSDMAVIPDKTAYSSTDSIKIYLNQSGTNFQSLQSIPINPYSIDLGEDGMHYFGSFQGGNAVDFNGDGKSDFYTNELVLNIFNDPEFDAQYRLFKTYYYNDSQNRLVLSSSIAQDADKIMIPGDFDGNGYTDILYFPVGSNSYQLDLTTDWQNGGRNISPKYGNLGSGQNFTNKISPQDFNGDGKTDLCLIDASNYMHIYSFNSVANQFSELISPFLFPYSRYTLGDINGDGKTDIVCVINSMLTVFFSDGKNYNQTTFSQSLGTSLNIADVNGDGKGDICESYIEAVMLQEDEYYYWEYHPKQYVNYFNGNTLTTEEINVNYSGTGVTDINIHFADFDGDGQQEQLFNPHINGTNYLTIQDFRPNDKSRLLSTILNGLNIKSEISYGVLPNSSSYSSSTRSFGFPSIRFPLPVYLVENVQSFGFGETTPYSNTSYSYQDFKIHTQGKGLLGFSKTTMVDSVSRARIESRYSLNPTYHIVFPSKTRQYQNDVFISESTDTITFHTYNSGERYFTYNPVTITENKLNGTKVQISTAIDQSGSLTNKTTYYKSQNGSTVKLISEIYNSFDAFGNPRNISVTTTRGQESITRAKTVYYNQNTGNIDSIVQPFTDAPSIITSYKYDNFGNITSENILCGNRSKSMSMNYEPGKGRFLKSKTNPLNHSTFFSYDAATGNILKDSTHTGIVTSYQYDSQGNLTSSVSSGQPVVNIEKQWSLNTEGLGETFLEITSSQNNPVKKTYYDYLGRAKRSKSQSFDGTYLVTDKEYDSRGRLLRSYLPYFEGSQRDQYIKYSYDSISRILTETKVPGNIVVNYNYYDSELKTKVTKGGQDYYKENDPSGLLFRATDPGGSIVYLYNAEDKVDSIFSPSGTTRITYDAYGYQDKLYDLDAGMIDYDYNGLGELVSQKNNNGDSVTYQYDLLGRTISKSWAGGEKTSYSYDPDNELVTRIASPGSTQIFSYDNLNRLITKTDSIDSYLYTSAFSYNAEGKIDTVIYNSSVLVENGYNDLGYLNQIKANDQTIWTANSMNRYGAINNFTLGNPLGNHAVTSFEYNSYGFIDSILTVRNGSYLQRWGYEFNNVTGNLTRRTGLNSSGGMMLESFTYDDLNRLTSFITNEDTISTLYDNSGIGNIEEKSDVGTYDYTGGLHDVRFIQNPTSVMISLPKHEAEYTKFNKISYLRDSINFQEERRLYLTYGPDEQRVKTIYMLNNDTVKTKYFALGNYEKEIDSEGNTRELYYISSPSGLTAILQKSNNQDSIFYIHTDYLGSYDVVTTSSGSIRQRYNFDPWGRRRNPLDWSYCSDSTALLFDRGFTGHEHLDQFSLINMNGRVYDPLLAMFISPDNYVQAPDFSQNFNRYAYCLNNPLKYTDPDGELFITLLVTLGNMYLNGAMANDWEFNPTKWDWSSLSTYTSIIQGGFSGYNYGTKLENSYHSWQVSRSYKRATNTEFLKMKGVKFNPDGSLEYSNENARAYYESVFKPTFKAKNGLRNIFADSRNILDKEGNIAYKYDTAIDNYIGVNGQGYGAAMTQNFRGSKRFSDIYLGKLAFTDKLTLHTTLGHELNHVAINYFNLPASEAFCYNWMVNSFIANGDGYHGRLYMDVATRFGYFQKDFESYYRFGNFGIPLKVGNF